MTDFTFPLSSVRPPFDLLLRIVGTPPSPSFDPLQQAMQLLRDHKPPPSLSSLLSQLSQAQLVLPASRPVCSRSLLSVQPLHSQRTVLLLLLTLQPRLPASSLLALLLPYAAEVAAAKVEAADWQSAEYDALLLVLRRLWRQLGTRPPDCLHAGKGGEPERWKDVAQLLRQHPNSASYSRQRQATELQQQQPEPSAPPAAVDQLLPAPPAASAFALLIRKMCEREGMQADDVSDSAAWESDSAEPPQPPLPVQPPPSLSQPVTPAVLVDFGDDVFALDQHDAAQSDAMDAVATDRSREDGVQRPQPAVVPQGEAAVRRIASRGDDVLMSQQEEADPASVMQSLLSSLLSLQSQLPDLNALFSTASSDAEFRSHPALAPVLPHVDALHRMAATGFSSALSSTASSGSPLSSLPSPLLYLFVRLVLTPSVNHSRACLLVSHCLSQAAEGAPHRLLLLTLSYAMATHPAAVFASLLEPLLASPSRLQSLAASHLALLRHCLNCSARSDLSLSLYLTLCSAIAANAASPSSPQPLPSLIALDVVRLFLTSLASQAAGAAAAALPSLSSSSSSAAPSAATASINMLRAVSCAAGYGASAAPLQIKYGGIVKLLLDSWPADCRQRRPELRAACSALTHFVVKRAVEKLETL